MAHSRAPRRVRDSAVCLLELVDRPATRESDRTTVNFKTPRKKEVLSEAHHL